MTRFAIRRVSATPAALELIELLTERHGPVAFFQPGGCPDGAPAICLTKGELLPGPTDVKLGEIGGSPFYVDYDEYESSARPALLVDVAPGASSRFSLEGLEDVHFVSLSPSGSLNESAVAS